MEERGERGEGAGYDGVDLDGGVSLLGIFWGGEGTYPFSIGIFVLPIRICEIRSV